MFNIRNHFKYHSVSDRISFIEKDVCAIGKEVGLKATVLNNLKIGLISGLEIEPASAETINVPYKVSYIFVNPLWLINWDHLPNELQLTGATDPKLDNRKFIKKFSDYISEEFNLTKGKVTLESIAALKLFLRMKENPKKAKQAWRCMIAHELGHLQYNHSQKSERFESMAKRVSIIAVAFLTFLPPPLLGASLTPYLAIAALAIPILGYGAYRIALITETRKREYEADKFAAKHLQGAVSGAEYGFTCARKAIQDTKRSKALTLPEKIISKILFVGNEYFFLRFTHGSGMDRIKRFKKLAAQS